MTDMLEVKRMLEQLEAVSKVLNQFQSDSADLSMCTAAWISLIQNPSIAEEVRADLKIRSGQALTIQHKIALFLNNRVCLLDKHGQSLEEENEIEVRDYFIPKDPKDAAVLAAFVTKDSSIFQSIAFNPSMGKLTLIKYWRFIGTITRNDSVREFCHIVERLSTLRCRN